MATADETRAKAQDALRRARAAVKLAMEAVDGIVGKATDGGVPRLALTLDPALMEEVRLAPGLKGRGERFVRVEGRFVGRIDALASKLAAMTGRRWTRAVVLRWLLVQALAEAEKTVAGAAKTPAPVAS